MRLEKVKWWTWKSDVKYHVLVPFAVFHACICWCRSPYLREETMIRFCGPIQSLRNTIGLSKGMLDCKCGRMYRMID